MMARAIPGRPSRARFPLTPLTSLASSAPCGAREEDKMSPWLSGHAIWRPQRRTTDAGLAVHPRAAAGADAVETGLRWLTDRWPGGTIGNEAEVYSGYYTEAASVSQAINPGIRRLPRQAHPGAR